MQSKLQAERNAGSESCCFPRLLHRLQDHGDLLKLYQIFIRQHVPMKDELASEAFDSVYADPAF